MSLRVSILLLALIAFPVSASSQIYIPYNSRYENYGNGSCVHASTITALNYLNAPKLARHIRSIYAGGEYHHVLNRRLHRWGIKTRFTDSANLQVLHYAYTRRLPAIISYHSNHSCLFLGWRINPITRRISHAYVLNPNNTASLETPTFNEFYSNWLRNDGEAVVIIPKGVK